MYIATNQVRYLERNRLELLLDDQRTAENRKKVLELFKFNKGLNDRTKLDYLIQEIRRQNPNIILQILEKRSGKVVILVKTFCNSAKRYRV